MASNTPTEPDKIGGGTECIPASVGKPPPPKYRTIVADPPWAQRYAPATTGPQSLRDADINAAFRAGNPSSRPPYPTLSVSQIRQLPVGDLGDRSCNLFLWATNRMLPEAFSVVRAWGFRYAQTLVWQKANHSPFSGRGSFAEMDIEFILVGRRGAAGFSGRMPSSVIKASSGLGLGRDGSAKPEAFADFVEQISPGPYLELFARRARFGWDYWGNESLETVELASGL